MTRLKWLLGAYMAFWSFVIGLATAAYLDCVNWVITFFWTYLPSVLHIPEQWQPAIICLPLSLLIGLANYKIGPYPFTIGEVLGEVHVKGHFSAHRWWRILIPGLLVLGAGASVGPEASASGLVAGMITWLGQRYKLVHADWEHLSSARFTDQLKALWIERYDESKVDHPITFYFKSERYKKFLYAIWTLFGIGGTAVFFTFFPQEGVFGFHTPTIHWQWQGLIVVIPALIVGWLFGYVFVLVGKLARKWIAPLGHSFIKAMIGGLLLVAAAAFSRDCLFSGEFTIVPLAHSALSMAPWFLLALALIKTLVTNVGFCLGWRGGTIFPSIFCSLASGAVLAQFLPWMPLLTVSLVVASAITVILDRPILTAVLICLLLPVQFSVFIVLACLLTKWVIQRFPVLKP